MQPGGATRRRLGRGGGRGLALVGERSDILGAQHAVVHADLVHIAAAHEMVAALHLMRRDHAAGEAELVEPRIEIGDLLLVRDERAIDEELHALGLVPGEGDVLPGIRCGRLRDRPGDADPRQIGVGDEGVEAVAVPVDPQERHVPAGVIGKAGAEDHERRNAQRFARPPEEAQRAALRAEIARRLPRDIAVIGPARRAADRAVGDDADVAAEIGDGIAARDVGGQAGVGRGAEQQAGVLARILRGGGGGEGDREQARATKVKAHRHGPIAARGDG